MTGDDPRIVDYALWFIRTVKTFCQEQPATQHIRGPEYASQYKLTAARRQHVHRINPEVGGLKSLE